MNTTDNNISQTYGPATPTDEDSRILVIFITAGVNSLTLSKDLIFEGVPQGAIGYEEPDGDKVGALFVKPAYAEIVDQICKRYDALSESFNIDFEAAQMAGLVSYLEYRQGDYPEPFYEYVRFKRAIEKAKLHTALSSISIKFICEQDKNYLRDPAPVADDLVSIIKNRRLQTFIPQGVVGQLVGVDSIGKTHLLTQLALSVAGGIPLFNEYPTGGGGHVFMASGENSDDIHRLLKKLSNSLSASDELIAKIASRLAVMSLCGKNAAFVDKDGNSTTFYSQLFAELKRVEPEAGLKLIILDPVMLGAQAENNNAVGTPLISLLERFTLELNGNPTVLFGDNMSNAGISTITNTDQNASIGSSAITNGVRWQANLERVENRNDTSDDKYKKNQIRLRIVKSSNTPVYDPIMLCKVDNGRLELCNDEQSSTDGYYDPEADI